MWLPSDHEVVHWNNGNSLATFPRNAIENPHARFWKTPTAVPIPSNPTFTAAHDMEPSNKGSPVFSGHQHNSRYLDPILTGGTLSNEPFTKSTITPPYTVNVPSLQIGLLSNRIGSNLYKSSIRSNIRSNRTPVTKNHVLGHRIGDLYLK
jgi:hypothetical protein